MARKTFGNRIDGGEIEFVSLNPEVHTKTYVWAVRTACWRRIRRCSNEQTKAALQASFLRLGRALVNWDQLQGRA